MAERSVFWRIATNFQQSRRDADRFADSMERVARQTKQLDDTSAEGSTDVERATRRRSRATEELVRQSKRANAESEKATRTTRQAVGAEEAMAKAADNTTRALGRRTAGARRATVATQASIAATAAEVDAQKRVEAATNSRERAALALERAQARLVQTEARHGQSSQQYAQGLLSVRSRTLELESATQRYANSLSRLDVAQRASADNARTSASGFGRGAQSIKNLGNSVMNFPTGVVKGIGKAMLIIIPIASLLTAAVGFLTTGISALSAGAIAVIGPLGGMVNAAAAIPQVFTVAAGAIGTFLAAFSGIGEALKTGAAQMTEGGKAAKDLAKQEKQAARAIVMAARAVRNAREAAADSSRQYNRALGEASEAVNDAKEAEIDASKNLSEARKQARQDIEDLKTSLRDLALAERGAAISVEEARRRLQNVLADPGSDELSKQQAQLAYDEALARMDDVKKQKKAVDKETEAAVKKGVNGSEAVIDAQKAEADAAERLVEAQLALADTRREAQRAARDSAEAIADAEYNLAEAISNANDVTSEGSKTLSAYNDALNKLSPAGKRFVALLLSMKPALDRLRFAAQEGLLPGLGEALVTMTKLLPLAEKGLFQFGRIIGRFATRAADLLTSDAFMPMWERLLKSNNKILALAGDALLNLLEAVVYLMDAARPFTEWLATTVVGWTNYWKELSKAGNETGKTADALERTKETLKIMGGVIKNVWKTFRGFARAGRKEGIGLLKGMEDITGEWSKWANSPKGQKELKEWFTNMRGPLSAFSDLMGAITRGIFDMGRNPKNAEAFEKIIERIREMGPDIEDLLTNLQGDFGLSILNFLGTLVSIFEKLTDSGGGGLTAFIETLGFFAEALNTILENDGAANVVTALATALGVMAALKFTGVLAGLRGVYKGVKKVQAFRNPAGAVAGAAGQAGGAHRAAGSNTIIGGSTGGSRKAGVRKKQRGGRIREKMQSRKSNEGGFIALGGGDRKEKRGGTRKAAKPSSAGNKAGNRMGGAAGKMGKGAAAAGGAVGGLALALSFLPGPLGEVASKVAIVAMVFSALGPVISGAVRMFGGLIKAIAPILGKLVGIVVKAMMLIGRAMLANPWMLLVAALVIVGVLIYKNWDKIKKIIAKAIDWVINFVKKHWNIIKYFIGPLAIVGTLVYKHWDKIKAAFKKAIEGIISFVKAVWSKIKDWIIDPIKKAWDGIGPLWDKIHDKFKTGSDKIKGVFTSLKDAIKNSWDKIKSALAKPVEFVVNTVINDWLIGNVNDLLGKIGLDSLKIDPLAPVKFARGGPVPGHGNRDSVDAQLMPGEFVLRRDAVKSIGVNRLHALNEGRSYRGNNEQKPRRYGFGDIVKGAIGSGKDAFNGVTGAAKSTWGSITTAGGKVLDLAKTGVKKSLEYMLKPARAGLNNMDDAWVLDDAVKSMGNKLLDAATNWIGGARGKAAKPGIPTEASTPYKHGQTLNRGGTATGVSALLTPGEFVFNQDSVSRIGVSNLRRLNRSGNGGSHALERFAAGGPVRKRRRKPREGFDGDAGLGGTPIQKFAKGGMVRKNPTPRPGTPLPTRTFPKLTFKGVKEFLLKGEVEQKRYTGTKQADKKETIRQFLREAYGQKPTQNRLQKFLGANGMLQKTVKGKKGTPGTPGGASAAMNKALSFAKAQNGKPYVWGGSGPGGYDCSGFMGSITNVIKGNNPYSRLFATGSMSSALPGLGFRSGLGGPNDFSVGWFTGNPGHTSGTLGTLPVESTGSHVRVGSSARSASNSLFNNRAHLPLGTSKGKKGTPGTPDKKVGKKYTMDSRLKAGQKYKVPDLTKLVGGKKWGDVTTRFGLSDKRLYDFIQPHIAKIKAMKGLTAKPFLKGYDRVNARLNGTAKGGTKPAKKKTPAELYLEQVQNQAKREKEWVTALSTISVWGFSDLVEDLMEKGIDGEGVIQTAIEASKNQGMAKRLNDALKNKGDFTSEDLGKIMKTLSYLSTGSNVGLRDLGRHLQSSDYDTVKLVENGLKTGHLNPVKPKMKRLNEDISNYRKGTFYANTGGPVPGVGNKDTVPAMLTPGEFVIKKAAARALGLENLMSLNGAQKFASGGEVMAPKIARIPTKAIGNVSSRALTRNVTDGSTKTEIVYDIDINNPVAEPGTRSMMKALQRQAVMPGNSLKKKGTES